MTHDARWRGKRALRLEMLETRSLLSGMGEFSPAAGSWHEPAGGLVLDDTLWGEPAPHVRPDGAVHGGITNPERSIAPTEPPLVVPNLSDRWIAAHRTAEGIWHITVDGSQLNQLLRVGQPGNPSEGIHFPSGGLTRFDSSQLGNVVPGMANVYREGDWLIVDILIPAPESQKPAMGDDTGDDMSGTPAPAPRPSMLQQPANMPDGLAGLRASIVASLRGLRSEADSRGDADAVMRRAVGDGLQGDAPEGGERMRELSSSVEQWNALGDGVDVHAIALADSPLSAAVATWQLGLLGVEPVCSGVGVGQMPLPSGESATVPTEAHRRGASSVEFADTVKGVKIRAVFAAASGAKVVDLAVIQFEKPVPVRVQLPFVLDEHAELGRLESASEVDTGSNVESVNTDASALDAEGIGLRLVDLRTTGALAGVAALLGYVFGRQRGVAGVSPAECNSFEPFTPVFDEIQLRRLRRRLTLDAIGGNEPA